MGDRTDIIEAIRDGRILRRQVSMWQLFLAAAITMAGGGGAGTWVASAQVDERLRDAETTQVEIQRDIEHIKRSTDKLERRVDANTRAVSDLKGDIQTQTEILKRIERKVD